MPALSPLPRILALTLALCFGCAGASRPGAHDFFGPAGAPDDVWFAKVDEWQKRARTEGARLAEEGASQLQGSGVLREKMASFASRERRELAAAINLWSRLEARRFYVADHTESPEFDHWPTISEILENDGDDCDGLDLIPYQLLLEFGFPSDQIYRLIARRKRDGVNHMVTLWFEDPVDPWVLDATGAMTYKLRRFSEIDLADWTPVKVFNEERQFRVVERHALRSAARD